MAFSSGTAKLALILAMTALIFTSVLAITYSIQMDSLGSQHVKIVELEKRLADLECRHVRFEDGSTIHADAERVAECAYIAPVFAKYGD